MKNGRAPLFSPANNSSNSSLVTAVYNCTHSNSSITSKCRTLITLLGNSNVRTELEQQYQNAQSAKSTSGNTDLLIEIQNLRHDSWLILSHSPTLSPAFLNALMDMQFFKTNIKSGVFTDLARAFFKDENPDTSTTYQEMRERLYHEQARELRNKASEIKDASQQTIRDYKYDAIELNNFPPKKSG